MKVVGFLNNKGGVGKTGSLTTLAHMIATTRGKRVLVVDIDPQANTSQLFGFTGNEQEYSLTELLNGRVYPVENTVEDILLDAEKDIKDCIYETGYGNLFIIPSYITLSGVENQLLGNVTMPQQFRLKKQLEKVKEEFDICMIDCGPSVSLLNVNALAACDGIYIPSRCDKDSRVGVANIIRLMKTVQEYNPNLELKGVFLTQYDARKNICKDAEKDCEEALGNIFLKDCSIPVCTKMEQTGLKQKPLLVLDPYGKAIQQYEKLTEYILNN